ncbi:MAG: peptide ABC transporter substrate-binding protein, partial [Planctomycetes bacterium]|nr:peptide ABC transporter substrate-binding protein [Planctomycetota bacterium]
APALLVAAAVLGLSRSGLERADAAFCNGAEPSSLDPHQISGVPEIRLVRALYEGLVVRDPRTAAPIPGLAESWTTSGDGLTWTFRIRAGSRWTDGAEVTADDFACSWQRLLDPRTGSQYADLLHVVRGAREWASAVGDDGAPARPFAESVAITAPDARTLVVGLEHPVDHFLEIAVAAPLVPVSRRALEAARARWPSTWQVEWLKPGQLVTNGPFRLVERRINDRIRLAKHPGYWDADEVALRTLDVLASEQLGTNLNFYLAGEVAYLDEVPASAIPRLRGREDFRPAPYLATSFLRVNVTRPPLDDVRVRRALALTIDRAALTAQVTRGGETPSWSLVPPILSGWQGASIATSGDPARDHEEARRLLSEAGFGPGRPLRFELHFASQATNKDVCEVVAEGWRRALPVEARLVTQEWKTYLATQRRLEYDVSRSSWVADFADAANFLEVFAPGAPNSRTGWSDARYAALLERARRAREPERGRILREAEALLLSALPVIPLYTFAVTSLVDPRLGGFHANALDEHFPKYWHWLDDDELAARRAADPPGLVRVASHGPRAGLYAPAETRRRAAR